MSPETVDDLVLRRAGPADDEAMRALLGAAFPNNPKTRTAMTRWQWWDNPFGETLAWVWDDGGEIVAQYVAICAPGWIEGRALTVTLGIDAAVAPAYQGRRLFTPLSQTLYEDSLVRGMPLYAYPNEQSWRGIARAGWVPVSTPSVYVFVLPGGARWLASRLSLPATVAPPLGLAARALFRSRRRSRALEVELTSLPPADLDSLWLASPASQASGIARGARWWQWRYDQHPDRPYQYVAVREHGVLAAAAAVGRREELGGRFLCILDLLAVRDDAARAVVNALADGLLGEADGVALTATPGSGLAGHARHMGLRRVPKRLQHRDIRFGVVPHPTIVAHPASLSWWTAWGDLDHI